MLPDEGAPSQPPRRPDLLGSVRGRRLLFAALYFTEGAPIGFLWWTLPVLLRRRGLTPEAIGALTAVLVLPWALKFVWAPLCDVLRGPRFGLRGWIVASQLAMIATLAPLLWIGSSLDPASSLELLTVLLVAHACAAATQDVAIDALAIGATSEEERGALNGWMQAGMLIARGVFGGAVLKLRGPLGDSADAAIVGLLMLAVAVTLPMHLFYVPPERARTAPVARSAPGADRWQAFAAVLGAALSKRSTWLVLGFAAVSGAAFEVAGGLAGPYLVDLGASDETIGSFYAGPAVVCLGLGALAGGVLADRVGRRRVILGAGLVLAVSATALALAGDVSGAGGTGRAAAWVALTAVYLGAGVFIASTYALFMDATDPRLGSTQFSAYMGATNLCESWSARVGGKLATARGYPAAFLVGAVVTIAALPLLRVLPGRRGKSEEGRGPGPV